MFQRRQNGSVDFYRPYASYVSGFGDVTGEHWLGLDILHRLTSSQAATELRVELTPVVAPTTRVFAGYGRFGIDSAANGYVLSVSGFVNGGAGDSLTVHSGSAFSTLDNGPATSCATTYHGAWWYVSGACHESNLNGHCYPGPHNSYADGDDWATFRGYYEGMGVVEMKLR